MKFGNCNGIEIQITCDSGGGGGDATARLFNTVPTLLSTTDITCGTTADITAPDGTVSVINSVGTQVATQAVPSGGTANAIVGDSLIRRSDLTTIFDLPADTNYTVADSPVTLKNSLNTTLSTTDVMAASSADIIAPDGDIELTDQNGNTYGPFSVPSGASVMDNIVVPQLCTSSFPFPAGMDTVVADIVIASDETYTAETLTNVTSVVYTLNASPVTFPFTLENGDVLQVEIVSANPAIPSQVIINGTFA